MQEGFIARLARGIGYAVSGGEAASWFGPQAPLPPAAPQDVAGRQFDYPFGFNLAITPRNYEPTGFAELRGLADSYDLLRCVIETRKDQVERLTWHIRKRAGLAAQAPDAARIAALAGFFARPDQHRAWASWLRMLLEDLLVIDAPTLYLRRTRGGALWALEVLDGATIKRLIDPWGRTPAPPAPAYQQILKGVPAVDYTADELIYAPRNRRAHKAYGFSPVEQVQMSINIALRRQIYQLQYYTEGNIPEALIGVPDSWNPDQIRQFQSYWDALNAGDTAERRHAKFVPGGVAKTFIPTREPAMKDVFDEWLARVICFAFSIPPSALISQVNRATAETAQDTALSEGLAPLQSWVKQLVDQVIASEFQAPDLEFAWDEDRAVDPSDVARIAASYVAAGIKSVNEVRAELGLAPVSGGDLPAGPKAPSDNPASATPNSEKLLRFNPNHYGPGEHGGQFAPRGEDSGNAPSQVAADDTGIASDASGTQIAQDEIPLPLGLPTARLVLSRQVANGVISQAEADRRLGLIAANDAQATARVNAALRGYVRIPKDWIATQARDEEGGVLYGNPADPQYDNVRIMPGDPQRSNPSQRSPYVIDQKSGKFLTTDGTRVQGGNRPEVHIPLQNYRFDQR
ncbi:MAG TPA: phage portal protein [Stellaceae bacterium]|nr:phage portal protein [Stellaceae bacterium]